MDTARKATYYEALQQFLVNVHEKHCSCPFMKVKVITERVSFKTKAIFLNSILPFTRKK